MSHKKYTLKNLWVVGLLLGFFALMLAPALQVNAAETHEANTKIYALACSKKGTHVVVNKDKSVGCTSTSGDVPNPVSLQAIGSQSKSNPYPNTIELTVVSVTCSGTGNFPVDPKLGALVSDFTCQSGSSPDSVKKLSVVKPASHPSTTVAPHQAPTGTSGSGTNARCDNNDALCSPCTSSNPPDGCVACDGNNCTDSAANPNADCDKQGCDLIQKYVNPGINLLSIAFGIIAVISLIMGAIQYSASGGDPQKVSQAKKRIFNTIVAMLAFFFLVAFLQFLIPGGIFG
jgi:hypothetical protein